MIDFNRLIGAACLLASASVLADDFDKSIPILCAISDYHECTIEGCESVTASSINAPTFFRLNAGKKTLQTITEGKGRVSRIDEVEVIDGKVLAAGVEDGSERAVDGVAYSIAITVDTGNLVFSAVTDDHAFTAFGACIRD